MGTMDKIVGIGMILFGIFIGSSLIIGTLLTPIGVSETECFDRFSNEIVGQVCLKEHTFMDSISMTFLGVMMLVIFTVGGLVIYQFDF